MLKISYRMFRDPTPACFSFCPHKMRFFQGVGGFPNFFLLHWNPNIFVVVRSPWKHLDRYNNPFFDFSLLSHQNRLFGGEGGFPKYFMDIRNMTKNQEYRKYIKCRFVHPSENIRLGFILCPFMCLLLCITNYNLCFFFI